MNALLRSEILRFRSRSLVAIVIVGGLLLIVVALGIAVWLSKKPTERALNRARYELERCPEDARGSGSQFIPEGNYYDTIEYVDYRCFSQYRSMEFAPPDSLALAMLPGVFARSSVIFVAVGICFGASLVGGDWHYRSMTTLLTWESRRSRVYVARMGTVILGTFLIVAGLELIAGIALAVTASLKGTLFGVDPLWFRASLETGIRVAMLAGIAAAITGSLAMISRSTAAALALLVAYVAYEQLLQAINETTNFWILGRSFALFLAADEEVGSDLGLDLPAAAAALAMYTGACLLAGYLVFSRRDVS